MPEIPNPPDTPEPIAIPLVADGIDRLSRVFHEPRRLAIMSVLCAAAPTGLSFSDLRAQCGLTDGNLNRHLKTLEEAGAITRQRSKRGAGRRPCTRLQVTRPGHQHFLDYLQALEEVLQQANKAASTAKISTGLLGLPPVTGSA